MNQQNEAVSVEGMSAVANYAMSNDWADRAANLIFSRIHLGTEPEPNFTIRKVTVEAWAELIRREWTATFGTGNIRPKPTRGAGISAEQFIEARLVPPLLHGDEKHQDWLRSELRKWIPDLNALLGELREERDALTARLDSWIDSSAELRERDERAESALAEARQHAMRKQINDDWFCWCDTCMAVRRESQPIGQDTGEEKG